MATRYEDGERISLSLTDVRILSTLVTGRMTGYEIGRKCEEDIAGDLDKFDKELKNNISNGTIYPALKRLRDYGFIEVVSSIPTKRSGRLSNVYQLSSSGLLVLGWEVDKLDKLVSLTKERLKTA